MKKQAEKGRIFVYTAKGAAELVLPMNDTYKALNTEFDDHGWKGSIAITFKDGKIVEVIYDEVNEEGTKKTEDQGYNERYSEKSGITAVDAYKQLQAQLIEKQDSADVDAVGSWSYHYVSMTI